MAVCAAALARLPGRSVLTEQTIKGMFRACYGAGAFWPIPGELAKFGPHVECGMSRAECEPHRLTTGKIALAVLHDDFDAALARRAVATKVVILGNTTLPQSSTSLFLGGYLEVFELSRVVLERVDVPGQFFFHVPSP